MRCGIVSRQPAGLVENRGSPHPKREDFFRFFRFFRTSVPESQPVSGRETPLASTTPADPMPPMNHRKWEGAAMEDKVAARTVGLTCDGGRSWGTGITLMLDEVQTRFNGSSRPNTTSEIVISARSRWPTTWVGWSAAAQGSS